MGRHCCCSVIFGLLIGMDFLIQTAASGTEYLPPPTNFSLKVHGMYSFFWEWKPPVVNGTCTYYKHMTSLGNGKSKTAIGPVPNWKVGFGEFDLNGDLSLDVEAVCNNRRSEKVNFVTQLIPGYNTTTVTDFSCVWYDMEYINCTWTVVQDPPKTYYYFIYWEQNSSSVEITTKPSDFLDLIDTGIGCTLYFLLGRWTSRCQSTVQEDIFLKLLTVTTDKYRNIKPYIFYTEARDIVQFSPPVITYVNMTSSRTLYLQWSVSKNYRLMEFEVLVKMSPTGTEERYEVKDECYKEIANLLPEVTYIVTVRARLNGRFRENQGFWSDWSEEFKRPGTGYSITTILAIVIPLTLAVAVIILLIFLKRLKICICPSIPDPAKSFPNELQEWIKTERPNSHNTPEKVEVYPVSLMESQSPSSQTN